MIIPTNIKNIPLYSPCTYAFHLFKLKELLLIKTIYNLKSASDTKRPAPCVIYSCTSITRCLPQHSHLVSTYHQLVPKVTVLFPDSINIWRESHLHSLNLYLHSRHILILTLNLLNTEIKYLTQQ